MSYFLREVLHGNGSRDDVDSEAESAVVARDFASLMYNCVVKANKNEILRIPMTKEFELKVSKDKEETSTSEVLQAKFVVGPPSSFACTAMAKAVLARYGGNLGFCMEEVISEDEPGPSRQNANDGSSSPQNRDQLVGAGLSCIFEILQQLSRRDAELCVQALDSLLGLIQTMPVDCLRHENKASIIAMIAILKKLREEGSPSICAQASSCLAALSVACGEPEHIASAIQSLICLQRIVNVSSDSSYDQIQVPENLHRLLLKVRQKISHRLESGESWASTSLQNHRVMCSFDLPSLPNDSPDESPDDDHRLYAAIACDGAFIYVLNYVGLYKLGTGLQETIIGKLYASNQALKATKNCLLTFCNSSLYLRRSQSSCISVVDVDSLSDIGEVVLPTCAVHSAIFSDGFTFYRATLTINSTLSIVPLNDSFVPVAEGVPRRKFRLTDVAFASFGDKRSVPHQLPQYLPANLQSQAVDLQMGKDIAFLQARSGKVYYAGNGTRFGLHETGNVWMELVLPEPVVQISVGSENVMFRSGAGHAWIAGVDEKRRNGRLRRLATANRRKTVSVCCCSSTFAYATENGKVFVGGRHSMRVHPTSDMLVGLDWVHIASVSLGKTHGAAISRSGHLYTWGFNNLNQCGRVEDIPSACAQCGLCSSRGAACGRVARPKGTICNCGIGESTCLKCGLCRSCGQMAEPTTSNVASQNSPCGSTPSTPNRMVLLPARVTLCKGAHDVKVSSLSCGNFHTILLAADKRVFTFGSNCHGQLGVGDVASKTQPQQVNLPADVVVVQVAAGANHSVLRTSDGAVYTFGTHSKGQLARASDNTAAWHCVPGRVPGYGPGSPAFASWVGADGDVTLIHSHTALLTNDDVVYSQIVASKNDIFIFPREIGKDYIVVRRKYNTFEHFSIGPSGLYTFWTMEPRFDMLWSYNAAEMKVQALSVFTKHAKVKDCNDALESLSFLATPEFAVPVDAPAYITSTQMGILLLSSAFAAHTITNSELWSDKVEESPSASDLVATERYSIANRFEGAGGGWGYSAHSIEAIQFKVSKEVRLVGVGLYGGRGEYMSKLKLYRLLGGDADELYVEQITETDETLYDCGAHETATLLFTQPIVIHANQWHVISAKISGPSSDCGASGKCTIDCDGVTFTFRNSVVSNNGTDVNVGQIPELYYQMNCQVEPGKNEESMKPLDLSISRIFLRSCLENVTPNVLTSLLAVLDWSIITLVNEDTEGDEKSWRAERAAFVALVTMRSISRYVLLVYTDSPTAEEPSFEFASRLVELHTMLISFFEGQSILFDEVTSTGMLALTANLQNISLQQVMSEAIRLFVSLSHCFMGSRGLINAHLVAAMKCGLQSEFLIAAVVGSLAKIGRIVEFLLNISCEERFPLLSAQLAKQFDNEETDLKTLTSYQNVLRFLYDLCFHNQMTNVHNTSKLTQDIIVKISHELAIPSVDRCLGPTVHQTSSRFRRRSGQANWDMSDGCPDAIAFRVDLEGVKLHGFGVYLTSDQEKLPISGEIYMLTPEAPEKWTCLFRVSVELSADGQDFGVVRFPDQVLLSPGVTYAIKVWTTKISKTYCGEGGANQLRLSNGARFFFSGCSLSQNGTTVQRGQIPFILYSIAESSRGLHVTQEKIHESYLLLLRLLSNKIGAAINSGYLSECARSIVSRISGHTIVFMEKFPDKCLEIMATLEPLIPLISNANGMIKASTISASFSKESQLSESPCIPVVVESPHPYKPNSVFSMVVGFDESVDFMCVRFSPNCETAQFDDQLCVYLGVDRHSYMPIDNYYGSHEWPSCPMFLPGNSLWFVLESASPLDGATAEQMYGFHVTVTGYPAASRNSDLRLEQELVWLSANACRIMVQLPTNPKSVEHLSTAEDDTKHLFERHGCLLKKGLSLSHAPTLNELIVKGPPQPAQSSELQFLRQFLSCHPSTAAGFLGSWLPTGPIVDPSKCQLAITHEEMVVGKPVRVKFSCRDQFDREVECNNISVEVLMTMGLQDASKTQNISADSLPSVLLIQQNPFQPVIINHAKYMSICAMAAFSNYSIEEIRLGYMREDLVRDRIILRHRNKSVFAGSWTPMAPGTYRMDCKVDGYEISQFYTVDVMETNKVEHVEKMWRPGAQLTTAQSVVLPFSSDFSGIRMRLGTTLASTCVGTIPRGAIIEYIEEIENDDGKWIRLTDETSILYGYSGGSAQVWCMAFHRPLRRDLIPLNEKKTEQPGKLIKPGTLSQASGQYQSVAIDAFETYIVPANDVLQVYSQPNMNALMDNERIVGPCDLVSSGWLSNRNGVWIKIAGSQKYVLQSDGSSLDGLDSSLSFSTNGNEEDELRRQSSVALPIATPPSIADCSRAVFAAFIWHEHLVKDAMAAAAYLKFHSNLHNIWHSSESLSSTNAPVALQPIVKLWREVCVTVETSVDQHLIVPPVANKLFATDTPKPGSSNCELCENAIKVPLTVHFRMAHPGCGGDCQGYGYNSSGKFTTGWSGECGAGGRGASPWYLMCNNCRSQYLRKTPTGHQQETIRRRRDFRLSTSAAEARPELIIKANALFLLDLNSSLDCDSKDSSQTTSGWTINLFPTQSSTPSTMPRSAKARLDNSIAKSSYMAQSLMRAGHTSDPGPKVGLVGSSYVASLNQTVSLTRQPTVCDAQAQAFLQSPSTALRTLFSHTNPSTSALLKRPVLAFCLEHHNLKRIRTACAQSVRRAVAFSHAFRVWNWLLRLVSSETSVSDIILQYLTALTSYKRLEEYVVQGRKQQSVLPHPWRLCFLAGPIAGQMVFQLHSFLYTISVILQSSGIDGRLRSLCFNAWTLQLTDQEQDLLILTCNILATVGRVLSEASVMELSRIDKNDSVDVKEMRDVTHCTRIEASSRQAMVTCLTDGNAETFWESGDEDKNRVRTLNVVLDADGVVGVLLSVFVDNVRDENYRISSIVFRTVLPGGTRKELATSCTEKNFCGWVKCCIANVKNVSIALKGLNPSSRIRQLSVLGFCPQSAQHSLLPPSNSHHLFFNSTQRDAFALFQSISSQAFCGELSQDETLRERVIDLLFSRVQLYPLQNYVCTQVVQAMEREVEVLCSCSKKNFSYCCGLMELLVRICDSRGASELSVQGNSILVSITQMLVFAPIVVQRQCLNSLECVLGSFAPGNVDVGRVLRNLLIVIGKVVQLQIRDKAAHEVTTVYLCSSVQNAPQSWRIDKPVETDIGRQTAQIVSRMCDGSFSAEWAEAVKAELAKCLLDVVQMSDSVSSSHSSSFKPNVAIVSSKRFWLAITALAMIKDKRWLELSERWRSLQAHNDDDPMVLCENHDDGHTEAQVLCLDCEIALCKECFTVMHLHKKNRNHGVKTFARPSAQHDVNIHQGCARMRIANVLVLFHGEALNGMVEVARESIFPPDAPVTTSLQSSSISMTRPSTCRFCGNAIEPHLQNLDGTCDHEDCVSYATNACSRALVCSHLCGGIRGELNCLPCLRCYNNDKHQDGDDVCVVCFTERLGAAPCVQIDCGHIFHFHCLRSVLQRRWNGPRILFRFINCPLCNLQIKHPGLFDLLEPVLSLRDDVIRKAKMRLEYDGLLSCPVLVDPRSEFYNQPEEYALDRYMYVLCHKCNKAYFGGESRCQNALDSSQYNPEELICGACSDTSGVQVCNRHGVEFLEYKCRFCCSIAVYFCFGTTHFCAPCHDDFQRLMGQAKAQLPQCPVGPRAMPLEGGSCPLKIVHPPTGEEFAMGCGICRNISTF